LLTISYKNRYESFLRWVLLTVSYKKLLRNFFTLGFANDYLEKTFSKSACAKKNLIYPISPITFAPTDWPSHCSFIPIQRSKNQNSKTEISRIINPFSFIFIYKKRDERETEKRKKKEIRNKKKDKRNKNRNPTISISNGHNF
jgi:hypothetical protein